MAKKEKKESTDLARLKKLKEKLDEIQSRWHAMTPEEQNIVAEAKKEINQLNNKS
jgi:hypothetical protein